MPPALRPLRLRAALLAALIGSTAAASPAPLPGPGLSPWWQALAHQPVQPHPEPAYRFVSDLMHELAPLIAERPGVIRPFELGRTVKGRPIWAYRVSDPARPITQKVLVMGAIHPLEWVSTEVVVDLMAWAVRDPPPGLEIVFIPVLNVDGRVQVEEDLLLGEDRYRRGNANGVDLNRDFAVHREARAIWRHLIPARYSTSPAALSQPETRALDGLAAAEGFDLAISLHAFGGFHYFPWAGDWARPADWEAYLELGRVMQWAEVDHAYKTRQLSRWGFFFRGHGMELDHLYGTYGTKSFLIEMTRSGISRASDLGSQFRLYNPRDPAPHSRRGVAGIRALLGLLAQPELSDRWGDARPAPPGDRGGPERAP